MRKLIEDLQDILTAEATAQRLVQAHGPRAAHRLAGADTADHWSPGQRELVLRALRARMPQAPRRAYGATVTGVLLGLLIAATTGMAAVAKTNGSAVPLGQSVETGVQSCLTMLQAKAGTAAPGGPPLEARLLLLPPTMANPNLCTLLIDHQPGEEEQILSAVDAWAAASPLGLAKVRDREQTGPDRRATSWAARASAGEYVIVLSKAIAGAPGEPLQSTVLVTLR